MSTIAQSSVALSHVQESVNTAIHHCNVINKNFDGSFNEIHHIVLADEKLNNECLIDYNNDAERKNTHPLLLPKVESGKEWVAL